MSTRLPYTLVLCSSLAAACGATTSVDEPDAGAAEGDAAATLPDAAAGAPDAAAGLPDAAPVACPDGGVLEDGVCVRQVPCLDVAPPDATSTIVDVTITYTDGAWSEPAACAWTCDAGCASGGQCVLDPADLGYNPAGVGSRWFGGDDRDLDGDGAPDVRSVGAGQSFVLADPVRIERVRLGFASGFYSAATGVPHAAEVTVQLRAADGAVLATATRVVPDTFTGGWIGWDLDASVAAGTYLLTAYAPDVFATNNYTAPITTDYAAGFADGTAYGKELADDAAGAMGEWTGWQADPSADHAFAVRTACPE